MEKKKKKKGNLITILLVIFATMLPFAISFAWFASRDVASGVMVMGDAVNVIIKGNETQNFQLFEVTGELLPGSKVPVNDIIIKVTKTNTPLVLRLKMVVNTTSQGLASAVYENLGIQDQNWFSYDGWYYYTGVGANSKVMKTVAESGGTPTGTEIAYNGAVYMSTRPADPAFSKDIVVSSVWNTAADTEVAFSVNANHYFRIPMELTAQEIADKNVSVDIYVEAIQDFLVVNDVNVLPTIENVAMLLYPEPTEELTYSYVSSKDITLQDYDIDGIAQQEIYSLTGLDGYEVTGIGNATGDIVVPQYYNGPQGLKPVIGIGEFAISYHNTFSDSPVTSVTLPNGLLYLDVGAIYSNCIQTITIPNSVQILGFYSLSTEESQIKFNYITLGSGLTHIGYDAFAFNNLYSFVLPSTLVSISDYYESGWDSIGESYIEILNLSGITNQEVWDVFNLSGGEIVNDIGDFSARIVYHEDGMVSLEDGVDYKVIVGYIGNYTTLNFTAYDGYEIGSGVFNDLGITYVNLGSGITAIGSYAFSQNAITSLSIPNSVTLLSKNAFYYNQIQKLSLGSGITQIPTSAFRNNPIENLTIPGNVTDIGNYAFANDSPDYRYSSTGTLTIRSGVININTYAFQYNNFSYISLPSTLLTIGQDAFNYNNSLTSLTLPNSLSSLGIRAFANNTALTTVNLGTGITLIPNYAFYSCAITNLTIPNQVITINQNAFRYNAITSLNLGTGVTLLGDYAFANNLLTTVTIPAQLAVLSGGHNFMNNPFISVTFLSETPPSLSGSDTFYRGDTTSITVYVPLASVELYTAVKGRINRNNCIIVGV